MGIQYLCSQNDQMKNIRLSKKDEGNHTQERLVSFAIVRGDELLCIQ